MARTRWTTSQQDCCEMLGPQPVRIVTRTLRCRPTFTSAFTFPFWRFEAYQPRMGRQVLLDSIVPAMPTLHLENGPLASSIGALVTVASIRWKIWQWSMDPSQPDEACIVPVFDW
jgi:hypothetical protein